MDKMKPPILIDSNIWIALYNVSDTLYQSATELITNLNNQKRQIIITNFIIQEVFGVLSKFGGHAKALEFYDAFKSNKRVYHFDVDKLLMQRTIDFIKSNHFTKSLGLTDYTIIFFHAEFGFEIASFDKNLMKIAQQCRVIA